MAELFAFNETNTARIARTVNGLEGGLGSGGQLRRPIFGRDVVPKSFRNDSGETIPAHAVMRVTDAEEDEDEVVFLAAKPNATRQQIYLVNGDEDVEADGFGWGTFLWHADYVLYNDANTPAYGEMWGPESGSWKLAKGRTGFGTWGHNITDEGAAVTRALATQIPIQPSNSIGIPFINLSGETIPPSGIMDWIGDVTIGDTPHVKCYKPGYLIRRRWLVNGTTAIAHGDTAIGSWLDDISGFGAFDIGSLSSLAPHQGFGPRPGSWLLYPGLYGFQCVSSQFYFNGSWVAHFRQEEVTHLKVKLLANLQAGSFTLAAHMYRDNMGQFVESPFTDELVVRDGGYLRAGEFIASNRSEPIIADIEWLGGFWELTNAQCEAEAAQAAGGSYSPGGGQMAGQFALNSPSPPGSPAFPSL